MRNIDRIRALPPEELAHRLVCGEVIPSYDVDENGEWTVTEDVTVYTTSDGTKFRENEEEALDHEIRWLYSEEKTPDPYDDYLWRTDPEHQNTKFCPECHTEMSALMLIMPTNYCPGCGKDMRRSHNG